MDNSPTAASACGVIVVEGQSDVAAVSTAARQRDIDLDERGILIVSADGVTNFAKVLRAFTSQPERPIVGGLYDDAEERVVMRALRRVGHEQVATRDDAERLGFFACVDDLEGELIRALGTESVEAVLDANGELASFRIFQRQPAQRGRDTDRQLRRFMGTRSTRKTRYGTLLVEALDVERTPRPLQAVLDHVVRS